MLPDGKVSGMYSFGLLLMNLGLPVIYFKLLLESSYVHVTREKKTNIFFKDLDHSLYSAVDTAQLALLLLCHWHREQLGNRHSYSVQSSLYPT